jgi:hypothetical protein
MAITFLSEDHKVSESMRRIYKITLLVFTCLLTLGTASAQTADEVLDQVSKIMSTPERAGELTGFFEDRVEISVMGKRQAYSSTQAQYVVSQFVSDYPTTTLTKVANGETNGTIYAMIEYRIGGSGGFDVNLFIRLSTNRITEIQFEKR